MNVLPMPPETKAKPHFHKPIETIAYMLEGECTVFHGAPAMRPKFNKIFYYQ